NVRRRNRCEYRQPARRRPRRRRTPPSLDHEGDPPHRASQPEDERHRRHLRGGREELRHGRWRRLFDGARERRLRLGGALFVVGRKSVAGCRAKSRCRDHEARRQTVEIGGAMNKTMTSFVIAVAVCVSAIHARAQKPETDPDAAEYKAYRLTMSTLTKIEAATKQYIATMKTDPKYKAMVEQKDGPLSGLGDTNQSLTESAAEMDKFPPIANALKANGLTSRE